MSEIEYNCTHCGQPAKGHIHINGERYGLQRCNPVDSGLPYGYNAHPKFTACKIPCLGAHLGEYRGRK